MTCSVLRQCFRLRTVLAASGLLIGCLLVLSCAVGSARAQQRSEHVHSEFLNVPWVDGATQRVHIVYPRLPSGRRAPEGQRYPLVVALHGRGESAYGVRRGALAWYVDYHLAEAFGALFSGEVEAEDLGSHVTEQHLAQINRELSGRPYPGVMVAAPYVPDLAGLTPDNPEFRAYADWLAGPLVAAIRQAYPQVAQTREGTGIEGVSMGGMVALETGLAHPETFAAVGAMQPALSRQPGAIAADARAAGQRGGPQRIRLMSSRRDTFLPLTTALSEALQEREVPHSILVVPGPHGMSFNRGPGAIELLRFAAEALIHEQIGEIE